MIDGSGVRLSASHLVGFYTWNCQTMFGRWGRTALLVLILPMAAIVSLLSRAAALRLIHLPLRGMSQDRLEAVGEEYFEAYLKRRITGRLEQRARHMLAESGDLVLCGHTLVYALRPLACHLGVSWVLGNRPDVRKRFATGRLCSPVICRSRFWSRWFGGDAKPAGDFESIRANVAKGYDADSLATIITTARRTPVRVRRPLVVYEQAQRTDRLSVRETLSGKHILLAGVTGFIGKVWLAHILQDVPDIGRIYLLIRRNRLRTALERFERIVSESPVFSAFHERYGDRIGDFFAQRVEVVEGDLCAPGLGIDPEVSRRLHSDLDLLVNSSGLTEFSPDLRDALSTNVDGALAALEFVRQCDHAALVHLSTCYVAGKRDGLIPETLEPNYAPRDGAEFDAENLYQALRKRIDLVLAQAESAAMQRTFAQSAGAASSLNAKHDVRRSKAPDKQMLKAKLRWVRDRLRERGTRMAKKYGWPNTYCLSKSLAESLILNRADAVPFAIIRPAIVESAQRHPFPGWNEGINTSAPLSHLLGTFFRQLPSNKRKYLDVIPVDMVCRGMSLIAAALIRRCHQPVYHLATSGGNPCDIRRTVEMTGLAHRRHRRQSGSFRNRLWSRFDAIPVSKTRYIAMSAPAQKAVLRGLNRIMAPAHLRPKPLVRAERDLDKLQKLIQVYEPFLLYNEHAFAAENIRYLAAALAPDEAETFGYDVEAIDWWDYWINVHLPGLRRWVFPLIEGKVPDPGPTRPFRLQATTAAEPSDRTRRSSSVTTKQDPSACPSSLPARQDI